MPTSVDSCTINTTLACKSRKRRRRCSYYSSRNNMLSIAIGFFTVCAKLLLMLSAPSASPVFVQAQFVPVPTITTTTTTTTTTTCSFNGQVFQAGESLGDLFTTRCGSASEYPCYCRPDAAAAASPTTTNTPIDCPYCGIATQDNEDGLVCARIDGPNVNVIPLDGSEAQSCTCQHDFDGNPQSVCFPAGSAPSASPPTSPTSPTTTNIDDADVCTLEWADGTIDVFQDGESYGDLFPTQCGGSTLEYPCFCNISIPEKLYCPYCSVLSNTGELACGRIGETFQLIDAATNEDVTCLCRGDLEADCVPTSSVITTPTTTSSPSLRPTLRPTTTSARITADPSSSASPTPTVVGITPSSIGPVEFTPVPTIQETTTSTPRQPSVPLPTLDKPSILMPSRTPPISVPIPGCTYIDLVTGQEEFVEAGGIIFLENATTTLLQPPGLVLPCSPSTSYPAICNPDLPGKVEYPYCVFSMNGELSTTATSTATSSTTSTIRQQEDNDSLSLIVCAKNGEQVSVPTTTTTTQDGTTTASSSCSCLYLNPFIGAVSSCPDLLVTVPPLALATPSPSSRAISPTSSSTAAPSVLLPGTPTTTNSNEDNPASSSSSSSAAAAAVASVSLATCCCYCCLMIAMLYSTFFY